MGREIYRALVVDDEPMICEGVAQALAVHNFCCDTAFGGRDALDCFNKNHHDLVVADLRMPDMHGHTMALELLRASPPPHIVILTGIADERLCKELFGRGVTDVVQKPIDFSVFATKMQAIFERNRWSDSLSQDGKKGSVSYKTQQIAKLESSLELYSRSVPRSLDHELLAYYDEFAAPPPAMVQYMKRLMFRTNEFCDRRLEERVEVFSRAMALPITSNFVVLGNASVMTLCNVSESGACLFHTRSAPSDFLALRWRSLIKPNRSIKAVLQVGRCRPVGPFYEIGGTFVILD